MDDRIARLNAAGIPSAQAIDILRYIDSRLASDEATNYALAQAFGHEAIPALRALIFHKEN